MRSVSRIDNTDACCVHFSDGSVSDPLPYSELSASAKLLIHPQSDEDVEMAVQQPKKRKPRGRGKKNRSIFSNSKSARKKAADKYNRGKAKRATVAGNSDAAKPLRAFGPDIDAAKLQDSINSEWQREQDQLFL